MKLSAFDMLSLHNMFADSAGQTLNFQSLLEQLHFDYRSYTWKLASATTEFDKLSRTMKSRISIHSKT